MFSQYETKFNINNYAIVTSSIFSVPSFRVTWFMLIMEDLKIFSCYLVKTLTALARLSSQDMGMSLGVTR